MTKNETFNAKIKNSKNDYLINFVFNNYITAKEEDYFYVRIENFQGINTLIRNVSDNYLPFIYADVLSNIILDLIVECYYN